MDDAAILEAFARNFVVRDFRERFLHESLKRRDRMSQRICHQLDEMLLPQCEGKVLVFAPATLACSSTAWASCSA